MPISMEEFKRLPKVLPGTRKGGKKIDWDAVFKALQGSGAYTVKEVWSLAGKYATGKIEKDSEGKDLPAISKFRTQRWLNQQVEKHLMECKGGPGGDYVYAVSVIPAIKADTKLAQTPAKNEPQRV